MSKRTLDLHPLYNDGDQIDRELRRFISAAVCDRIETVVIIPGKGSGQLKKRVVRFLQQADIKQQYHRYEIDERNFGKITVHFRHGKKRE